MVSVSWVLARATNGFLEEKNSFPVNLVHAFTLKVVWTIVSGLVLLLAMIAAIILTLQKYFVSKNQNIYNQILKDYNTAIISVN